MKTKITKTLIESWQYTFDCAEGYEDEAMEDFLATLKREPKEPTEAMINGTNFENLCYKIANGEKVYEERLSGSLVPHAIDSDDLPDSVDPKIVRIYPKWYAGAKKVADIITGGQFQVPVSCDLTIAGRDIWLYGICDVVKAGTIFDVKFRNKSLGSTDVYGKYLDCSQHPIYLRALPEASRFIYLVSDGDDLYTEEYNRSNSKSVEYYVLNFLSWLQSSPELMKIYEERWAVE